MSKLIADCLDKEIMEAIIVGCSYGEVSSPLLRPLVVDEVIQKVDIPSPNVRHNSYPGRTEDTESKLV